MDATSSFTPEVTTERLGIAYRFKFPSSGLFQCSLTELVFNVTHEGEVTYKTLIWDDTKLQTASKLAGGPLFSIECPQDSISQVHLPHCEPEPALVSESLSVVSITDDGMSIIQPLEVTETHVVVNTPQLSAFGIVWDLIKRFRDFMTKPLRGQIVLFLRPIYRGGKLILSVILLPSNVPLREVKAQHENAYIQAPPYCLLHIGQHYSLYSDPEGYTIQPASAQFFDNYGPNYHATFEIVLTTSTEEVTLMVRDPDRKPAWKYCLHLPASPSHASRDEPQPRMSDDIPAEEKLRRCRPYFIDRASYPVLDTVLDELLQGGVLNDAEFKAVLAQPREDKARDLIDMVRMKGAEASSIMITSLSINDSYLTKGLGLM